MVENTSCQCKQSPWNNSNQLFHSFSIAVVVPFYAASLVETVQSDIASEKPGIFDVFREGGNRLLAFHIPQKGRMIPVWALLGPSIAVGLSKYIVGLVVHHILAQLLMKKLTRNS